ncbi:hypothetical protein [Paludibaculum fermentans]|uniref:hypothetical protein n=1 Tax=Paludibaculum fermentans TaxID=1473598 RepID=UPI003EB98AA1
MFPLALALLLTPADYAINRLKQALPPDVSITSAMGRACPQAVPAPAESLSVARSLKNGKTVLSLCGADQAGLMYAALDTADRIRWAGSSGDPLRFVENLSEQPAIAERAVSMYTMQRALFEQRLHDPRHWERYFDLLAASRINSFVIIFGYENGGFMAPLYPYFFDTPGFDSVRFNGITTAQQARNTESFRTVMRLAHERGIRITVGIWDHIYRGGVQGGGIPGASENAGKVVPGLVSGLDAENLAPYTKAALRRFLATFPDVDAIQFRMHDESGLKPSEMQAFWHEVFGFIHQIKPELRVDLRAKGLPDAVVLDALDQGLNARVTTKYWMEQMGLPFHPTHINTQNQRDRRHGYADLLTYPQRYQMVWRLWNGGTSRLLLWTDPEYVRRFAASARLYGGSSIEVNEMLATHMLGSPHDEKPGGILNPNYRFYEYDFERYWDFYRVWGRASYNPETPITAWQREYDVRFGTGAGVHVMRGLHLASQVLPRIVAVAYRYQLFPTTRGWAEMMREESLPRYADLQGSDIEQFLSPREEAHRQLQGTHATRRRPQETSAWFTRIAASIEAEASLAEQAAGSKPGRELATSLTDLRILAGLARYHSHRLLAAVSYNLYLETRSVAAFDDAIRGERQAVDAWRSIVKAAGDVYTDNLAFGVHAVGFPRHWKEELSKLENDFAELQAQRPAAMGESKPLPAPVAPKDQQPPWVTIRPVEPARLGQPLEVAAVVHDPSGVSAVRLRYRHLTQYEDYNSLPMTLDAKSGSYTASIPASFVNPRWDLMFFVEAIDKQGNGRNYPDFEVEAPYVIVPVLR